MSIYEQRIRGLKDRFDRSHTIIRRLRERPKKFSDSVEKLNYCPDPPGAIRLTITRQQGVSIGGHWEITHEIIDFDNTTAIESVWGSAQATFLGKEHDIDTFQFDPFTTITNEYPFRWLRRLAKRLTCWQPNRDIEATTNQQLGAFRDRLRLETIERSQRNEPKQLSPIETRGKTWQDLLGEIDTRHKDFNAPVIVKEGEKGHNYANPFQKALLIQLRKIAILGVKSNAHGYGNDQVIAIPLDGRTAEEHGIEGHGAEYVRGDRVLLYDELSEEGENISSSIYLNQLETDTNGRDSEVDTSIHWGIHQSGQKEVWVWGVEQRSPIGEKDGREFQQRLIYQVPHLVSSLQLILSKLPE